MRAWLVPLLLGWPLAAGADLVTYDFTAEVTSVNPAFASIVSLGSPAMGRFRYDTTAVDLDPDPKRGSYPGATLEFTIGAYAYAADAYVVVYDDDAFDGFQIAGVVAGADPIDGAPLGQADVSINAGPGLYASDALPAAPPLLGDPAVLPPTQLRIGILPPGSGITYQSADLQTLPEADASAGALVAAAALAGLAGRRIPARG